jgi:S1-C subfamily serine protease
MHLDLLDAVLAVAIVLAAFAGYRRGFVAGLLSLVGFIGGGILGTRLAVPVADWLSSLPRSAVGLVVVLLFASLGQAIAAVLGAAIRRRLRWRPLRAVDSLAGAVLSIIPVLFIAWLLGRAVLRTPYQSLAHQVQHSRILTAVDTAMPSSVDNWFADFFRLVESNAFPALFSGTGADRLIPVAAPNPALVHNTTILAAATSVVKVVGLAPECARRIEGSGFIYADQHILTNAHVVAGVGKPTVQVPGGGNYTAHVVLYDPRTDIAVLDVPGLTGRVLSFATAVDTGASAVVAGYPEDGPFSVEPARVRVREEVSGPDIYGTAQVTREVYALRSLVRPGNSGGPLLSPSGGVYGVVFAAATGDPDTGYALTAAQVRHDAGAGATRTSAVSTDGCD